MAELWDSYEMQNCAENTVIPFFTLNLLESHNRHGETTLDKALFVSRWVFTCDDRNVLFRLVGRKHPKHTFRCLLYYFVSSSVDVS